MRRLAERRPLVFTGIVTLTYMLGLLAWLQVLPDSVMASTRGRLLQLGMDTTRIIIPVVFLTLLGWWRIAGFTHRPTRARLLPFLPLALYPLFPLLFGPGFTVSDPEKIALLLITCLAVGFGEEATFRGVVLRALAPRGMMRAAVISSVLFGAIHLVNLATGANPVNVGFQIVYTAGIGFAFAAAALVTGAIWPLVAIHCILDFANALQASEVGTATAPGPDVANGVLNIALAAIFAGYGYWLLRRHVQQSAVPSPDGALRDQRQARNGLGSNTSTRNASGW